jgi:hypothetical protein
MSPTRWRLNKDTRKLTSIVCILISSSSGVFQFNIQRDHLVTSRVPLSADSRRRSLFHLKATELQTLDHHRVTRHPLEQTNHPKDLEPAFDAYATADTGQALVRRAHLNHLNRPRI